jgi:hypothetical protein
MKRYTISQARERLADVLNEAERSGAAVIERRDVRYVIRVERPARKRVRKSIIESLDASIVDGQWSWSSTSSGVRFAPRRTRS